MATGLDLALSLSGRRPLALSASVGNRPAPRPLPRPRPRGAAVPLMYANAQRNAAAANVEKREKAPSLFEQFSDVVTGLPAGLAHLAGTAAQTIAAPVRIPYDVMRGDLSGSDALGVAGTFVLPWQSEEWGGGKADKYLPLTQEMGTSFGQTGLRLRHPSRYLRAIEDGQIVSALLEDAGNIALVAGGAGKALGAVGKGAEAAGMTRTASALERGATAARSVSKFTNEFSDAPVALPRKAVSTISHKLLNGQELPRGLRIPGLRDSETLRRALPRQLTDEGKRGIRAVRAGDRTANRLAARIFQDLHRVEKAVGDKNVESAAMALLNKVGDTDALAAREIARAGVKMTDQQLHETLNFKDIPEHTFTPEARTIARGYLDGTLDADTRAKVDMVMEAVTGKMTEVTDRALAGDGRLRGNLDPQQLGDDPIDSYMDRGMKDMGIKKKDRKKLWERLDNGETWDDLAVDVPEIAQLLDDPMMYPAAWRPAMVRAGRARTLELDDGNGNVRTVTTNMPVRPSGLLAAGVERPMYLPGGETMVGNPKMVPSETAKVREGFEGMRGLNSEYMRTNAEVQPYSLKAAAEKIANEVRTTEKNRVLLEYAESLTDRVNTIIDPAELAQIRRDAQRLAKEQVRTGPKATAKQAQLLYAQEVNKRLAELGYEPFQGSLAEPKAGDFNPAAKVDLDRLSDSDIVLPKNVKNTLATAYVPRSLNVVVNALDKGNAWWKSNVLPFSLRWQLGDVVGGQFMSWVGGGIPPWELTRTLRDFKKLPDDVQAAVDKHVIDHPELVDSGLAAQEQRWARGKDELVREDGRLTRIPVAGKVGKGYNRVRRGSFKINEQINHWNRHSYVLAKLDRLLEERGLGSIADLGDATPADFDYIGATWDNHAAQQAAIEAFDALPDDAYVYVYHGTDAAGAQSILKDGVLGTPTRATGRTAGQRTGWNEGVYVAPTLRDARRYGDHVVRFKVRKGDLAPSLEARNFGDETAVPVGRALFNSSAGAVIPPGMPAEAATSWGPDKLAWTDPEVQKAITEAVNDANKVMGTFDELTPFEQRTLKNVFPFYVWTRHITTLAWRTALDNPARMLWTLRIGAMGNEQLGEVPDWLRGSIRIPDWMVPDFIAAGDPYLPLNWANPFNDIGGGSMLDRPTKNMSPLIKLPVAAATGINMSTDLPFTRPFGTGNYNDVTGSAERTPLWQRPGELAYVGLSTLPLGRFGLNIGPTMEAPGTEIGLGPHPRYQQGTFMVNSRSRPIDQTSRWTVTGQALGIPMPTSQEDVDSIMAAGRERKRARRNASRNVRSGLPG